MSAFDPLQTFGTLGKRGHMRWRYGYSWTLFFAGCAVVAFLSQSHWPQRIILFLVMMVPLTLWTLYRMKRQA